MKDITEVIEATQYKQGYDAGIEGYFNKSANLRSYKFSERFQAGWAKGNAEYKTRRLLQGKPIYEHKKE
jgi:hypothetical protein